MSILGYRRLTIALGIILVGLVVLSICLFLSHGLLRVPVAWAGEQTQVFEEMRERALQSSTGDAADFLAYIVNYYPSGSKQQKGSPLDQIVERERILAEQDIISYLRSKTSHDLGARPEAWIQQYAQK